MLLAPSWREWLVALLLVWLVHVLEMLRPRREQPGLRDAQRGYLFITILVQIVVSVAVAEAAFLLTKLKGTKPSRPSAPTNNEGRCLRRIYGTVWIDDPVQLAMVLLSPEPIKKKVKGPLGIGSKHVTTNYWYHWVMHFGWCGTIDALLELRGGSATAWSGEVADNTLLTVSAPDLWGGEDSGGGIDGQLDVRFGREGQLPSDYLVTAVGVQQCAHLGKCTTIFQGGRYGAGSANPEPLSALVRRLTQDWLDDTVWYAEKVEIPGSGSMNPAHVLYDSLTHPEMMGEPVALVNDASFRAAADRLYDEGLAIDVDYDEDEETIEQFQQRICDIIGGALSQSRIDGQWYLDLVRGAGEEELPEILEDDIIEATISQAQPLEAVNIVRVEWFDRTAKLKRLTAPIASLGAIASAGRQNTQTQSYPEIATEALALRLGQRDLNSFCAPLHKLELTVQRRFRGLRLGRLVRVSAPSDGIVSMICVVGAVDYGDRLNGNMALTLVENVFDLPSSTWVNPSPGLGASPTDPPAAPAHQAAFEIPYSELASAMSPGDLAVLPPLAGFVMTTATQPGVALNYDLYTALDGEDYQDEATGDWTPSALITEGADQRATAFHFTGGALLDRVKVGSWALWGDEVVRVDALSIGFATITLGRGCFDTPPIKHDAGERIWFCGDWAAEDPRQFAGGDEVHAKLVTRTTRALLALDDAVESSVTLNQRAYRPYAPQSLKIGGDPYPAAVTGDTTLTCAHRDRLGQGTAVIDTTAGDVGPEAGVTYSYEIHDDDSDDLLDSGSGLEAVSIDMPAPGSAVNKRAEIWAVRDGVDSWKRHIFTFQHNPVPALPYGNAFLLKFTSGALADKVSGSTLTNSAPTYIPGSSATGIDGPGLDFAPTSTTHAGYIAALPVNLLNQGEFIFEFYLNITAITAYEYLQVCLKEISGTGSIPTDPGVALGIEINNSDATHGTLTLVTAPTHSSGTGRTTSSVTKTKGTFVHVSFRKVASSNLSNSGTVYVYIDGVLVLTTTTGAWTPTSGSTYLHLWAANSGGASANTAVVDEILGAWWVNKAAALADPNSPSSLGGGLAPPSFTPAIYYPGG